VRQHQWRDAVFRRVQREHLYEIFFLLVALFISSVVLAKYTL
jgi:hypothetical protein